MAKTEIYQAYCEARAAQNRLRQLQDATLAPGGHIWRGGRQLVNFASNDYLGLSQHPALIEAACTFARKYGAGVAASRLVTGENPAFAALEARLAAAKNQPSALVLAAGYQTNLTAVSALADKEVAGRPVSILADRLAHHSLLQGALLSGARLMRFQHNDCDHLESLLRARSARGDYCVILTESVFGMDGDLADLGRIGALAREFNALLYVDEAHATGVFGARGFGLCEDFADVVDVAMGTFGKALGGFGSYLACATDIREFLI
jgi:8-amino-7-oxononanoate synthase